MAALLGEIHEGIGLVALMMINTKLQLPDEDANKRLAGALIEVNKHYRVPMPSPKHMALLAMGAAAFNAYKPTVLSAIAGPEKPEEPSRPPAPN
jgi:hypothetical protein